MALAHKVNSKISNRQFAEKIETSIIGSRPFVVVVYVNYRYSYPASTRELFRQLAIKFLVIDKLLDRNLFKTLHWCSLKLDASCLRGGLRKNILRKYVNGNVVSSYLPDELFGE